VKYMGNSRGSGKRVPAFEVQPEEIHAAFDNEDAVRSEVHWPALLLNEVSLQILLIYTMECMEYPIALQRDIVREAPAFRRALHKDSKKSLKRQIKVKVEVESEVESESSEELVYRPRPSLSRSRVAVSTL